MLITPHDAGVNCSYRGYVPTMKFDYGETYGNHTAKYFQDYRSRVLETSNNNYHRGGYFPSYYSYNGNVAAEARTRKWNHWLQSPHYRISNVDHDRKEELINFAKVNKPVISLHSAVHLPL